MNKRDYSQECLESEFAYQILRVLNRKESYPTEIAAELNSTNRSVSNYLKGLKELELVENTRKEGRKRYYDINDKGIYKLFKELWKPHINEYISLRTDLDGDRELEIDSQQRWQEIYDDKYDDTAEIIESKFPQLVIEYSKNYLRINEKSTIRDMLLEHFWESSYGNAMNFHTPEWFDLIRNQLERLQPKEYPDDGDEPLKQAFDSDLDNEIDDRDSPFKDLMPSNLLEKLKEKDD